MGWRVAGLVLVFASGCAAHRPDCAALDGLTVLQFRSPNFVVTTDREARLAHDELQRLEARVAALTEFFGHEPVPVEPFLVFITSEERVGEFAPGAGSLVTTGLTPRLLMTERMSEWGAHTLGHVLTARWLDAPPRWLGEGLAEYFGEAESTPAGLQFGQWKWKGGVVAPLLSLWAWPTEDVEEQYARSAWAWIHFLVAHEPDRLSRLWKLLRKAALPREAFESVFPASESDELQARVQAYVDAGPTPGWAPRVAAWHQPSAPVRLESWRVHLERRALWRELGWDRLGGKESECALAVSPQPVPFEVRLARIVDTLSGPERSDALVALDREWPDDTLRLELGEADDASPYFRRTTLESAAKVSPLRARAFLGMGRDGVAGGLEPDAALEHARKAVSLAPWSFRARANVVHVLASSNRCEEARQELQRLTETNFDFGWSRSLASLGAWMTRRCGAEP